MSQNNKKNSNKVGSKVGQKNEKTEGKKITLKLPPADMNWYIMFEEEISVAQIAEHLELLGYKEIDVWNDINILTLEMEDKTSLDFEPMEPFESEEDVNFLEKYKIKTIYALTLSKGLTKIEKKICREILEKFNGLICSDSEELYPVYQAQDLIL